MPVDSQRALLLFGLSGQTVALPLESVEKVVLMAQLARPPGLPWALEGILNLAGVAVPVLRLDRLLQLPARNLSLYSMLIVVKGVTDRRIAMPADRVSGIQSVPESAWLPVSKEDSFNGCAEAAVPVQGQLIHLLCPTRILLANEHERLSQFQALAQERLQAWDLEIQ